MTVTCSHCGEILTMIPIIGEPDAAIRDLLGRMHGHLMKSHSKPSHNAPQMMKSRNGQPCQCKQCANDRVIAEAQQKAGVIMAALLGQAVFGQFSSADADYNTKMHDEFEKALKIVMEFEPKGVSVTT
jgi:hypothetical protein